MKNLELMAIGNEKDVKNELERMMKRAVAYAKNSIELSNARCNIQDNIREFENPNSIEAQLELIESEFMEYESIISDKASEAIEEALSLIGSILEEGEELIFSTLGKVYPFDDDISELVNNFFYEDYDIYNNPDSVEVFKGILDSYFKRSN